VVPPARKVTLLSRAVASTPFPGGHCADAALAENQFLVDAASASRAPGRAAAAVVRPVSGAAARARGHRGPQSVGEKLIWVLDLFATLDERQRAAAMGRDSGLMQATSGGGYS
jgi:hypothetical protein